MVIYKLTNIIKPNSFYIGKTTKSLEVRFYYHKYNALKENSQTIIHKAIRKYKPENFLMEEIDSASCEEELNSKEIFWISKLKPRYNIARGGEGGNTSKSPNYIKALKNRDMSGSNNPMFGKIGILNPKFGKKYGEKPNISKALFNPVICAGIRYDSIGEAQSKNPGISIRKRLNSPKYPDYIRLVPKRNYS